MKIVKIIIIVLLIPFCLALLFGGYVVGERVIWFKKDAKAQLARMDELRAVYSSEDYEGINEEDFMDFTYAQYGSYNISEIACINTHNSYKYKPLGGINNFLNEKLLTKLSLTESSKSAYYHETLTDQLNIGIRGLEIDVNARKSGDDIVFNTFHTLLDSRTCALSFDLALEELKLWSDANPEHIPITVLIEVKELAITPLLGNSLEVINALDDTIGEILGDKVLTPSEIMGTHSTFGAMRGVNDWIRLDEAKGQIMVVLHKSDMTYAYVNQDTSMDTFNMVPSFYYDDLEEYSDFASVLLMNDPDDDRIPTAIAANCIVRSRADTYPLPSEDYMKVDGLVAQGVNMITTDYPVRTVERVSGEYVAQLDTEGHTIIFVG